MKILLTTISDNVNTTKVVVDIQEAKTFGRTAQNKFNDGYMSKVHFKVMNAGNRASVQNLSEVNPVLLNGKKILEYADLSDGDKLQAGKTIFLVEVRDAALPTLSTPPPVVPSPELPLKPATIQYPPEPVQQIAWPADEIEPDICKPRSASEIRLPRSPSVAADKREDEERVSMPVTPPRPKVINWDSEPPTSDTRSAEQVRPNWVEQIAQDFPNIQRPAPVARPPEDAADYYCMEFLTSEDASQGYASLLESMSGQWCIELVLHFQKIRLPPPELESIRPLFTWLSIDDHRLCSAPFVVSHLNLKQESNMMQFLPRLCRADACIAFIGNSSDKIQQQIECMMSEGLEGFSEQGGFLPCCWPSGFATIIDCAGRSVCHSLFGDAIVGAYFCGAGSRKKLIGVGNAEFAKYLKKNNFQETQRITP